MWRLSIPLNGFRVLSNPSSPDLTLSSLSIPLNGFHPRYGERRTEILAMALSIPLNGFENALKARRVPEELSIPLNGFFATPHRVEVVSGVAFNSIEWIRGPSRST